MTYKPSPLEVPGIDLPKELQEALEIIAESIHDCWAENRFNEGWIYGESRNDKKKTHPSLVPYSKLSESEKEYDRITAKETIKILMSLGYKIEK